MKSMIAGGERLRVKFEHDNCFLSAQVLDMDEGLRETLRVSFDGYWLASGNCPYFSCNTLWVRGYFKEFDNVTCSYTYSSEEETYKALWAFIRLIEKVNHNEKEVKNKMKETISVGEFAYVGGFYAEPICNKEDGKMKKGEIQLVKNGLTNVTDGELELLAHGYSATDFNVRFDGYNVLITYKDLNTGEEKLLLYRTNIGYEVYIEECSYKNGIFKLKVSYDLGEKIEVEGE